MIYNNRNVIHSVDYLRVLFLHAKVRAYTYTHTDHNILYMH